MQDRPVAFVDGDGVKQIPIGEAVSRVGIARKTLLKWADKGVMPNGQPFKLRRTEQGWLFVCEDVVAKMEDRFQSVPDGRPAGRLKIGRFPDQSGFIPVNEAHRSIEELDKWISPGKLEALVKEAGQGREIPGIHLELVSDPLHRNKRYISERSLRSLMNKDVQAKVYPHSGKVSPLYGRPR